MLFEEIISAEEIETVHANADFGDIKKRDVVNQGVLKCASGYQTGSTSFAILKDHELVTEQYELTSKGRAYLWAVFGDGKF